MFARRNLAQAATIVCLTVLSGAALLCWQGMAIGQESQNAASTKAAEKKTADAKSAENLFRQLDSSGDGRLSIDEATVGNRSYMERIFKEAGKQPGDHVSHDEFLAAYERLRSKPTASGTKSPATSAAGAESSRSSIDAARSSADATRGSTESAKGSSETPPDGIGAIDTNGDGTISRAEWSKFTQMFSHLDTDKDNSLNATELEATGGVAELLMKIADANGDGKISRIEWGKMIQSFPRLDANHDSALDLAELQKAADSAVASASGSASLADGKMGAKSGPTLWRGNIESRGQIELLVTGNQVVGREIGRGGGDSLGAGTITMTGDGKSGNMDAVYTDGDRKGQVCLGIYKLDGNVLHWCVNNKGGRPQAFTGGGGNWLLTLTRVDNDSMSK